MSSNESAFALFVNYLIRQQTISVVYGNSFSILFPMHIFLSIYYAPDWDYMAESELMKMDTVHGGSWEV